MNGTIIKKRHHLHTYKGYTFKWYINKHIIRYGLAECDAGDYGSLMLALNTKLYHPSISYIGMLEQAIDKNLERLLEFKEQQRKECEVK